jgi:hypothetical protein
MYLRRIKMAVEQKEPFDEDFTQAIIQEAKRRGMLPSATCTYCGERLQEKEVSEILAHSEVCKGR